MAQFFARRAAKSSELNNKATKQKVAATLFLCFFVVNFERNQTDFACLMRHAERATGRGLQTASPSARKGCWRCRDCRRFERRSGLTPRYVNCGSWTVFYSPLR